MPVQFPNTNNINKFHYKVQIKKMLDTLKESEEFVLSVLNSDIDNADQEVGQQLEGILNGLPKFTEANVKESLLFEYLAQLTKTQVMMSEKINSQL